MRLIGIVFLLIAFGVLMTGVAEYILDREAERDRERLINEIIKEIERRNHEH